jgi:hypothetical protein
MNTVLMRSTGIARGSGVMVDLTFTLRQSTTSTIDGTVAGKFRFGPPTTARRLAVR